jgi:hypothetical protein
MKGHPTADKLVEQQLEVSLCEIEKNADSDLITSIGPILYGLDDAVRDAVEGIDSKRPRILVLLQTDGGYIEVANRISDTLHKFYPQVEFIIPNSAFSAGTVLAMSGHVIHMDYYSVLGPIDPQVQGKNGNSIPAHGYLIKYEQLIAKSNEGSISTAELQFLLEKFDPAELYRYEQAMELSVSLLKDWLVNYKFKNWVTTETRRIPVTHQMKLDRAEDIARKLNDTKRWHSHGLGISMKTLVEELKLQIEDFGTKLALKDSVRRYHRLATDYMGKMGIQTVVHARNDFTSLK